MGRPAAKIKKVRVFNYKTTDGSLHDTAEEAFQWQETVDTVEKFKKFVDAARKNSDLTDKQAENLLDWLCDSTPEFIEIFEPKFLNKQ